MISAVELPLFGPGNPTIFYEYVEMLYCMSASTVYSHSPGQHTVPDDSPGNLRQSFFRTASKPPISFVQSSHLLRRLTTRVHQADFCNLFLAWVRIDGSRNTDYKHPITSTQSI
ncbi:predicted protein [Histoplasma capsulatum H143]|uniref:Uncharacterized protein n=1 Tax=Ajellomyces capsulatus (strain H143) TaxID=544712 RepID=C6HN29_AJECH|nr:predicted protein [Histoplasma capsulatum H143]